jgi:hypothetical protein
MGFASPLGLSVQRGPRLVISASSVLESALTGSTVGVLSVVNGSGTYTFTKTADPDSKFAVSGSNLNLAAGLDYEAAQSHSVTISASNGVDAPIVQTFVIGVVNVDENPPLDFIWYGQSNTLFHRDNMVGSPAASANTLMWNAGTASWVTPTGNGLRVFLNAMNAATGRVCRAIFGGTGGVPISTLQKGSGAGWFEALIADVTASGANPAYIIMLQGEGDAGATPPTTTGDYLAALNTLHTNMANDLGKTRAQLPLVMSSLARVGSESSTPTAQQNLGWQGIRNAQVGSNAFHPNMHYSHSNFDATLVDGIHYDGASYQRSGARYSRMIETLLGLQSTAPRWFATGASRFSTTETDVTLVHSMGTDFTPSTGITGFEVSNDNGVTWVAATGARINATTIRLTHADFGTTERKVRYQFGQFKSIAGAVYDNSALAVPLNFTTTDLVATGAAVLPVLTYAGSVRADNGAQNQATLASLAVPGASEALLAIIGVTSSASISPTSLSVTCQPSGTVISATALTTTTQGGGGQASAAIWQALLPAGTTSITANWSYVSNPFTRARLHVSTIQAARLSSTTAVASGQARASSATSASTSLAASNGGVIFAIGSQVSSATSGTLSGTEALVTNNSEVWDTGRHVVGGVSGTTANASSSVTVTFNATANAAVAAASWR